MLCLTSEHWNDTSKCILAIAHIYPLNLSQKYVSEENISVWGWTKYKTDYILD